MGPCVGLGSLIGDEDHAPTGPCWQADAGVNWPDRGTSDDMRVWLLGHFDAAA